MYHLILYICLIINLIEYGEVYRIRTCSAEKGNRRDVDIGLQPVGQGREAVLTLDKELAQQVIVRERRVNAFELKIDSDVEDVIALYNPVAIDLRFVLAMLKINTNLERLGDFAEGIARFVVKSEEPVLDEELLKRLRLEEMQKQVLSMLEVAKRALNEESLELATSVFAKDNLLDEINAEATAVLAEYIKELPTPVKHSLKPGRVLQDSYISPHSDLNAEWDI